MLQTAKVLQTPIFSPSFVPQMPKTGRKAKNATTSTRIDRTGDARLWKLHDEFCREQAKLSKLDTREASVGSGAGAPAPAKRAFKKWEDQLSVTDRVARKIAAARAFTLDGMLMKIQVAGSVFDWIGKSFKHRTYVSHDQGKLWNAGKTGIGGYPLTEEEALIVSLRDDLLRLHARGGSR